MFKLIQSIFKRSRFNPKDLLEKIQAYGSPLRDFVDVPSYRWTLLLSGETLVTSTARQTCAIYHYLFAIQSPQELKFLLAILKIGNALEVGSIEVEPSEGSPSFQATISYRAEFAESLVQDIEQFYAFLKQVRSDIELLEHFSRVKLNFQDPDEEERPTERASGFDIGVLKSLFNDEETDDAN